MQVRRREGWGGFVQVRRRGGAVQVRRVGGLGDCAGEGEVAQARWSCTGKAQIVQAIGTKR